MTGVEARRWSIVFHREAENWFFGAIACGHFKHVSAFAFVPGPDVWLYYDVGFRRTKIVVMPDTLQSKLTLAAIVEGNAVITMARRDDNLPLMRLGLFCTTGVKHLVGIPSSALRPSKLYRDCLQCGGILQPGDDQWQPRQTIFRRTCLRFCSIMTRLMDVFFGKSNSENPSRETAPATTLPESPASKDHRSTFGSVGTSIPSTS